ncbi:MAG: DMT family transporter [Peptococcaceae bacterium]|nr:DMT family transporter [Peptococcaceae bacterium]
MQVSKAKQITADLALLFVAFVWGITFVVVKEALSAIGPYYFLAIRFFIAGVFLAVFCPRAMRKMKLATLKAGFIIGLALFGGYAFQTVALQYTKASNAGFITGLSVVMVPVFVSLLTRKIPTPATMIGVACATLGLGLLCLNSSFTINFGDVLVFLCAVCFATHIILVGKYAPSNNAVPLAVTQIATVSAISLVMAIPLEVMPETLAPQVQIALLATAIPATSLAFLIQNTAQKFTSATHTAVIFTMEPVFAGLTAWLLGGEVLSIRQWIGGAAIICGMLITVLKSSEIAERESTEDLTVISRQDHAVPYDKQT